MMQQTGHWWKRFISFAGPAYLVAVGYMDPGNWATAIAGGSAFGFSLLFVIFIANIMAIILQSLALRLGIATEQDLAEACRAHFSKPVVWLLWIMAQLAIIATDLAEIIGTAIALLLLFNLPLPAGVVLSTLATLLVLKLQSLNFRMFQALIIGLIALVAGCFVVQLVLAQPQIAGILGGLVPHAEIVQNPDMLYLAMGILGATVMPHNLYLHSSLVQARTKGLSVEGKREAIHFATIDTALALMFALLINASILILAASTFYAHGHMNVTEIQEAHHMLQPLLGSTLAPVLFGVALLACGFNSTMTATLAGQVVMEGFIKFSLKPWQRVLLTRLLALLPALLIALIYGASGSAQLLVLSQVVLSLQLPFAVIPLIMFVGSRRKMGILVAPSWLVGVAYCIALSIIMLNITMLWQLWDHL